MSDDCPTADQKAYGPAGYLESFIGRVVGSMSEQIIGKDDTPLRIPQSQVGIRTDGDGALARVEAVELCVTCRCKCCEFVETDPPLHHTFRKQDRETCCHTRYPVGSPAKVTLALLAQLADGKDEPLCKSCRRA